MAEISATQWQELSPLLDELSVVCVVPSYRVAI